MQLNSALASVLFLAAMGGDAKIAPWLVDHLSTAHDESFLVLFDDPEAFDAALAAAAQGPARGRGVYEALAGRARLSPRTARPLIT